MSTHFGSFSRCRRSLQRREPIWPRSLEAAYVKDWIARRRSVHIFAALQDDIVVGGLGGNSTASHSTWPILTWPPPRPLKCATGSQRALAATLPFPDPLHDNRSSLGQLHASTNARRLLRGMHSNAYNPYSAGRSTLGPGLDTCASRSISSATSTVSGSSASRSVSRLR